MSRIITHAEIARLPDGGVLSVEPGARLTPLAAERAAARGITLKPLQSAAEAEVDLEALVQAVTARVLAGGAGKDNAGAVVAQVVAEVMSQARAPAPTGPTAAAPGPDVVSGADYCATFLEQERSRARRRAVVTATGRNGRGIVARVTAVIAELEGDILDISQTLVGDYFTMILIIDVAGLAVTFSDFKRAIESVGEQSGFQCLVMHEDVVTSLTRV